jgi:hypothetical protein
MKNPFVEQGTYTLLDVENANKVGMIASDPYLDKVEFLCKFEGSNNSQNFINDIPNGKWFNRYFYFGKSGQVGGFGKISTDQAKFGNSSYFNSSAQSSNGIFTGNGLFFNDIIDIGKKDFTMECWIYLTTISQNNSRLFVLFSTTTSSTTYFQSTGLNGLALCLNSSGGLSLGSVGSSVSATTYGSSANNVLSTNVWQHIALVRKNGVVRVFVNGTSVLSSASSSNDFIGQANAREILFDIGSCHCKVFDIVVSDAFYADELRFTNGAARYWENFTPTDSQFPYPKQHNNNNVVALYKFENQDMIDDSTKKNKDLVPLANHITNADKKFGNSSLLATDYCSFHYLSPESTLNTKDFNISCWIKANDIDGGSSGRPIFSINNKIVLVLGGQQWSTKSNAYSPNSGRVSLCYESLFGSSDFNNKIILQTDNAISAGVWHHILLSRNNNTFRIFIDGILKATNNMWTQTSLPVTANWNGIAYGNSIYVTVAGWFGSFATSNGTSSNVAITSNDGISWTQRSLPNSAKWSDVIYGDKFVAIAFENNIVATSDDGISWSQSAMPSLNYNTKSGVQTQNNHRWFGLAYGNLIYVAIARSYLSVGASVAVSSDGSNWTLGTISNDSWNKMKFINNQFVAVGDNGRIATSSDGLIWNSITATSPQTSSTSLDFTDITYGNDTYIATVTDSRYIYTSIDLSSWTRIEFTGKSRPSSSNIIFADGKFYWTSVPFSGTGFTNHGMVRTSTDGNTWLDFIVPVGIGPILHANNKFVSVTKNSVATYNTGLTSDPRVYDIDKQYLIIGGQNAGNYLNEQASFAFDPASNLNTSLINPWGNVRFNGYIDEFVIDLNTGTLSNFNTPTESLPKTRYIY